MIKIPVIILAAVLLTACGGPARKAEKQPEKQMLSGGYTQQRPLDAEELELFQKATDSLTGVSYTPESVATQVVAGTNFRFICSAQTTSSPPETYKAEVTIFRPLPGRGDAKISNIKRL